MGKRWDQAVRPGLCGSVSPQWHRNEASSIYRRMIVTFCPQALISCKSSKLNKRRFLWITSLQTEDESGHTKQSPIPYDVDGSDSGFKYCSQDGIDPSGVYGSLELLQCASHGSQQLGLFPVVMNFQRDYPFESNSFVVHNYSYCFNNRSRLI